MRWADVLVAIYAITSTDSTLGGIYGDNIRQRGSQAHVIPSLDFWLVSNTMAEVMEPIVVQFDQWAGTLDDLVLSESRLLYLFDEDLAMTIGGITILSAFTDGAQLDSPTDDNVNGRALRFEMEPVRSALLRS